jgi:serpin B
MKLANVALVVALCAITVSSLGGCSESEPAPGENVETVRTAQQRDTSPTLSTAELDTLANGEASFAVDIFHAVGKAESGNVFLSPHSISIALGMTYAGARGDTAAEMKKALHLDLPEDRVHPGFNYLDLELSRRGANATGKDGKPFRLTVSNSIWCQKGESFAVPFLDTLAVNYGAGINIVDFAKETEKSRVTINGWVEKKTENRIKDLLEQGKIDASTRAVLVNAVYFNAAWSKKFSASATAQAAFHKIDGSTIDVPTMHASETFPYTKGDGYEAVALPYDGGELSMLVVVPTAGTYSTFESTLTGGKMLEVLASLQSRAVNLSFPKLKLEASFQLKEPLTDLGMKKAFTDADFSGMSTTMGLVIDDVVHKTFLSLDENGTEAAAATAVLAGEMSALVDIVNLNVDRPFITAIVDNKTRTLVFFGRIMAP